MIEAQRTKLSARRNGGKGHKQRLQLFATEHEIVARTLIQHVLSINMKRPVASSLVLRVALMLLTNEAHASLKDPTVKAKLVKAVHEARDEASNVDLEKAL